MTKRAYLPLLILLCLTRNAFTQQTSPATRPALSSAAEVEAMIARKEFQPALRQIAQMLPSLEKQEPSVELQRYQLLLLRAECLLQVGSRDSAVAAYDQASKLAADPESAGIARAGAVLARRSANMFYQPKSGGDRIDIRDPATRKLAMAALHTDLAVSVQPKLRSAIDGSSLQVMIDLLPTMTDLASLEYVVFGEPRDARRDLMEMGQRARDLMTREIRRVGMRLDEVLSITDAAGGTAYVQEGGVTRRALSTAQSKELRDLAKYVRRVAKTANQARQFAREMGGNPSLWEPVIADTSDLSDQFDVIFGQ